MILCHYDPIIWHWVPDDPRRQERHRHDPRRRCLLTDASLYRAIRENRTEGENIIVRNKQVTMPEGAHIRSAVSIRPAAFTTLLLALCLIAAGCSNPRAPSTPPVNAYALSGGKITRFIPPPGLPNGPTNKAMLEICRQLELNSDTAQGAYAIFQAREGLFPVSILIVGDHTLACLGDVIRNHDAPLQLGSNGIVILYPGSAASIILDPSKRFAIVGGGKVALKNKAVYWPEDKELIMSLPDLITVFHARDRKRGMGQEITFIKTIYDIRDYHRWTVFPLLGPGFPTIPGGRNGIATISDDDAYSLTPPYTIP